MRQMIPIIEGFLLAMLLSICGCNEKKPQRLVPGEVTMSFVFSESQFSTGEAICVAIEVTNGTSDDIAFIDFPAKNIELIGPDGSPIPRFQRAEYPRPPKMFLHSGEASVSEMNLTGFFENLGPGMLSPGKYRLKSRFSYYRGKEIAFKQQKNDLADSTEFEIVDPTGGEKEVFDEYIAAMSIDGSIEDYLRIGPVELSDEAHAKLDEIAERYPQSPIGSRILVNDMLIWYRNVPLDRFMKFFESVEPKCPCCVHKYVIDRLIKRYVIASERDRILDIAEEALLIYPAGSPVGDHLRRAFAFRIEDDRIIR